MLEVDHIFFDKYELLYVTCRLYRQKPEANIMNFGVSLRSFQGHTNYLRHYTDRSALVAMVQFATLQNNYGVDRRRNV